MTLRRLFILHAIPTFAAGVVLILAPALIPGAIQHFNFSERISRLLSA